MSATSQKRSAEFLQISGQFNLGALMTECSHPVTADLSETARRDIGEALKLLFQVDADVIRKYREFVESGRADDIKTSILHALKKGGRMFFTGCGSTGRLSIQLVSIWRDFWQRQRSGGIVGPEQIADFESRAISVMAGGDFALIKAVEGFEDFTDFGKKQIGDLGISNHDVVFAITEGGETSFVIGTAWKGVESGAKVFFVYNNPDDVLTKQVERSREIISDVRVEKMNLTTGPMAITGSTRMQATSIQLCVLLTILEMVIRDLIGNFEPDRACALNSGKVPEEFLTKLTDAHKTLQSNEVINGLAKLVALEERTYRGGHKNNYFADRFGIDVLTDTTERSPTYCTPPFRKFDDANATASWAFLFLPHDDSRKAWESMLKRPPQCIAWTEAEIRSLVPNQKVSTTSQIVRKISGSELMRFKIGLDGLQYRPLGSGDSAVAIMAGNETDSLAFASGFYRKQLEAARIAGASIGLVCVGTADELNQIDQNMEEWASDSTSVLVPVPKSDLLLNGVTRVALKMLLNALSTCTMVRLGRVMGNFMIWVVPSNLKLIDRATRYIQKLVGLDYRAANELLFEVIEYVEPRMKADQVYPPVVGLAVMRARHRVGNEEAERRLAKGDW